jgi:hypothetical protein
MFELILYNLLINRFYSSNIFSSFMLNFYPQLLTLPFFVESLIQIIYVFIIFYDFKTSNLFFLGSTALGISVIIFRFLSNYRFITIRNQIFMQLNQYSQIVYLIGYSFSILFFLINFSVENETLLVIFSLEILIILTFRRLNKQRKLKYVETFFTSNETLSKETVFDYICEIFILFNKVFSWSKLNPNKLIELIIFLYQHYKVCEDINCVCKEIQEELTIYQFDDYLRKYQLKVKSGVKENYSQISHHFIYKRNKDLYHKHCVLITFMKRLIVYRLAKLSKENFDEYLKEFIIINQMAFLVQVNNSFFQSYITITNYYKLNNSVYSRFSPKKSKKAPKNNYNYFLYFKRFLNSRYKNFLSNALHKQSLNKSNETEMQNGTYETHNLLYLYELNYEIEEEIVDSTNQYGSILNCFLKKELDINHFNERLGEFREKHKLLTHRIKQISKYGMMKGIFLNTKIKLYYKLLNFEPPKLQNSYITSLNPLNNISDISDEQVLIIKYVDQNFIIKNISHELIIMLEYTEDELINKDLHILLPHEMQYLHKSHIFKDVASEQMLNFNFKEIVLMSKSSYCYLFQLKYKFSFDCKGEMSLFCFLSNKDYVTTKHHSIGFICLDERSGSVIGINNEFEENCRMSMEVIENVNLDAEKLIFQNNLQNIKEFYRQAVNSFKEYQFLFDLDQYKTDVNKLDFSNPIEMGIVSLRNNNNKFSTNFNYSLNKCSSSYSEKNNFKKPTIKSWYLVLARNFLNKYNKGDLNNVNNMLKAIVNLRILDHTRFYFIKIFFKTMSFNLLDDINVKTSTKSLYNKKDTIQTRNFFKDKYYSSINVTKRNLSKKNLVESYKKSSSNRIVIDQNGNKELMSDKLITSVRTTKLRNLSSYFLIILLFLLTSIFYNIFCTIYKEKTLKENYNMFLLDYYCSKIKSRFLLLVSPIVSLSLKNNNLESTVTNNSLTEITDYYAKVIDNSTQDYIGSFNLFNSYLSDFGENYDSLHLIHTNVSSIHYIFNDFSRFNLKKNLFDELSNFHIKTKLLYYEHYSENGLKISLNNLFYEGNNFFNKNRSYLTNSEQDFYFITSNYFTNFNRFFQDSSDIIGYIFSYNIDYSLIYFIIITCVEVFVTIISIISQLLLLRDAYYKIKNKIIEISIYFVTDLNEKQQKFKNFLLFIQKYDYESYLVVNQDTDKLGSFKKTEEETHQLVKVYNDNSILFPKLSLKIKKSLPDQSKKILEPNTPIKLSLKSFRYDKKLSNKTDSSSKIAIEKQSEGEIIYNETMEALKEDDSVDRNENFHSKNTFESNLNGKNHYIKKIEKKNNKLIYIPRLKIGENTGNIDFIIIAEKILNENRKALFTLGIFSLLFALLYMFSLIFKQTAFEKIRLVNQISSKLEILIPSFFEITLLYRIQLLQNSTDYSNLYTYNNSFQDINTKFNFITYDQKFKELNNTFSIIENISSDRMCDFLSEYIRPNGLDRNEMLLQCRNSPNEINLKGFFNSLKTLKSEIDSMLVELIHLNLTKENIYDRLNAPLLGQTIYELEHIYRNVYFILSENIEKDIRNTFDDILYKEKVYSVLIITLNIVFLLFSMKVIILPIQNLNEKFHWILKKIYRK